VTSVAGRVCVLGGEDAPRNAFDAHVHVLQPGGLWKSGGAAPGRPLLGHGAAGLGRRLFAFGGREGGANTFSGDAASGESEAFLAFDVEAGTWEALRPLGAERPEPRSFHAMCSAGGEDGHLFVFGGCGASGRLNDLWRYSPLDNEWQCLHAGGAAGDAPVPRGGAGLVASSDGQRLVLLFGFSGEQQGDISVFDVRTREWELLPQERQKGDVPSARSVFCTAALGGRALLFGGEREASDLGHAGAGKFNADLHALDLEDLSWRAARAEGPRLPEARGWTGMAPLGPDSLLLFGGLNAHNERLGDAWELEVSE